MKSHSLERWQHDHNFSVSNAQGERRTLYVLLLTAITMVVEIFAGTLFGSMALLADGWHMGTHVAAFMITLYAYRYARRHAENPAYAFGTGKVSVLGGFTSATVLAVVALMMLLESLYRLVAPHPIQFDQAIAVACIGLTVNLISALMLKDHHHHHLDHAHLHDHDHHHDQDHHQDHNLRAAYLHVLADALTSVLAIAALLSGKFFGWSWLDPMMGVVGALIITRWSYGLVRETGPILLDASIEQDYQAAIVSAIERDADNRVCDIHIWKVGANHYAAIISLMTHHPQSTEHYKELLSGFHRLAHLTVEINRCSDADCRNNAGY